MTNELDGKQRTRAAALSGWMRGINPVGWNSRPGQEYICFREASEKADPDGLRRDMAAGGWKEWPDTHKDGTMEFSLYPVPARPLAPRGPAPEKISYTGGDCQYPMLWACAALLGIVVSLAGGIHPVALVLAALTPGPLFYPFCRLQMETFDDHFTFRRNLFGAERSVAYADIARVRIIAVPIGRYGHSSWHFVFLTLKSGAILRLYPPEALQQRFADLVSSKII